MPATMKFPLELMTGDRGLSAEYSIGNFVARWSPAQRGFLSAYVGSQRCDGARTNSAEGRHIADLDSGLATGG